MQKYSMTILQILLIALLIVDNYQMKLVDIVPLKTFYFHYDQYKEYERYKFPFSRKSHDIKYQLKEYPKSNGKSILTIEYLNHGNTGLLYVLRNKALDKSKKKTLLYVHYLTSGTTVPIFRIEVNSQDANDPFGALASHNLTFKVLGKSNIVQYFNDKLTWDTPLKHQFLARAESMSFLAYETDGHVPIVHDFNPIEGFIDIRNQIKKEEILRMKTEGIDEQDIDPEDIFNHMFANAYQYDASLVIESLEIFLDNMLDKIKKHIGFTILSNIIKQKDDNEEVTESEHQFIYGIVNSIYENDDSHPMKILINQLFEDLEPRIGSGSDLNKYSFRIFMEYDLEISRVVMYNQIPFQALAAKLKHKSEWVFKDARFHNFCANLESELGDLAHLEQDTEETLEDILMKNMKTLYFENLYPFLEQDESYNVWYALAKPIIDTIFKKIQSTIGKITNKVNELENVGELIQLYHQDYLTRIADRPPVIMSIEDKIDTFIHLTTPKVMEARPHIFEMSPKDLVYELTQFDLDRAYSKEDFTQYTSKGQHLWDLILDDNKITRPTWLMI